MHALLICYAHVSHASSQKKLRFLLQREGFHGGQQGDHALLLVGQLQMAVIPEPGIVQRPTIWQIKALKEIYHSRKLGVCQGSGSGSGFI